jgi:predicted sulfurtransferase
MSIVNIAGYKFTQLADLDTLKRTLLSKCEELELRGTILLAQEGTNQMLAGSRAGIDQYYAFLQERGLFEGITFKESVSAEIPFKRLFVKLKKEIIPCGAASIDPAQEPAPYLSPRTLKAWLDEGREVVLLDTRNAYEVAYGTFEQALELPGLDHFRDFSAQLDQLDESFKQKTIVTFCTGGIRCEKAAPLMQQKGFEDVYQLEGGILSYFEACGGAHYQGSCFVFDERVTLQPDLSAC